MGYANLLQNGVRLLRSRGVRETAREVRAFAREAALRRQHELTGAVDKGTPIYERDWDLLVILDACRPEALREVSDDYDFLTEVDEETSLGSYSRSWMERNFTPEYADEMANTVMVTGNPFTETALDAADFQHLEEVWRYSWDDDVGTIRPRALTDAAISLAREQQADRLIVHYMQPHAPFTTHPELQTGPDAEDWTGAENRSVWARVRDGELDVDVVRAAYMDELRHVLGDVELLLNNVDADRAVISADHGEAMGEAGLYGHARGVAIDALRMVPWATTSATDTHSYEPDASDATAVTGEQEQRLRDLGYL